MDSRSLNAHLKLGWCLGVLAVERPDHLIERPQRGQAVHRHAGSVGPITGRRTLAIDLLQCSVKIGDNGTTKKGDEP